MKDASPSGAISPGRKVRIGLAVLLCAICAFGTAVIVPIIQSAKFAAVTSQCRSSIKKNSTGILLYANDFDDRLPPSARWYELASPYSEDVNCCPMAEKGSLGYAMSTKVDRKDLTKVEDRSTVLLFETPQLGFGAIGNPRDAVTPSRHTRNHVSFLDGHVTFDPLL